MGKTRRYNGYSDQEEAEAEYMSKYTFADYLADNNSEPPAYPVYALLDVIREHPGAEHVKTVFLRSSLTGKPDLYALALWAEKDPYPSKRIMMNLAELRKLYRAIHKVLELEDKHEH